MKDWDHPYREEPLVLAPTRPGSAVPGGGAANRAPKGYEEGNLSDLDTDEVDDD